MFETEKKGRMYRRKINSLYVYRTKVKKQLLVFCLLLKLEKYEPIKLDWGEDDVSDDMQRNFMLIQKNEGGIYFYFFHVIIELNSKFILVLISYQ